MRILIGLLLALLLCLLLLLLTLRRQILDICRQLAFLKKHDSNMQITSQLNLFGVRSLTAELNELLAVQRQSRAAFSKKEQQLSDTYTNLSHDIRTPLTSLDGYFQLLERSEDSEEQQRYLTVIRERISSLKELLEELFLFSRLQNADYPLPLTRCSLSRVLSDSIFSYYEDWTVQGIEPELSLVEMPVFLNGNVQALRRVIQNIIRNSLCHGTKALTISLRTEHDYACLEIGNCVLQPETIDIHQVFERFYRSDAVSSGQSAGLGLSIARELTLRMGGTIDAQLTGDRFIIRLCFPLLPPVSQEPHR